MRSVYLVAPVILSLSSVYSCGRGGDAKSNIRTSDNALPTPTATPEPPAAKTLEQCNGENLSWIAVVENGDKPPACGAPLASWCCTETEILKRFPKKAAQLGEILTKNIETDGFKLYNCSKADAQTTTLHFAKVLKSSGLTQYRATTINRLYDTATGSTETCPVISSADLLFDDSEPVGPLKFIDHINPILNASCAGSTCHSSGSSLPNYVDNEAGFAADEAMIAEVIQLPSTDPRAMPPGGTLSADKKAMLLKYIGQQ